MITPVLIARVEGASMEPTLHAGDVVLAVRRLCAPRVGALVVAEIHGRRIIKRVAAYEAATRRCLLGVEHPYGWVDVAAIVFRVIAVLPAWNPGPRAS